MLLTMMLITRQEQILLNNLLSNLFILSYITNTLIMLWTQLLGRMLEYTCILIM
jgi:hypothetical protein